MHRLPRLRPSDADRADLQNLPDLPGGPASRGRCVRGPEPLTTTHPKGYTNGNQTTNSGPARTAQANDSLSNLLDGLGPRCRGNPSGCIRRPDGPGAAQGAGRLHQRQTGRCASSRSPRRPEMLRDPAVVDAKAPRFGGGFSVVSTCCALVSAPVGQTSTTRKPLQGWPGYRFLVTAGTGRSWSRRRLDRRTISRCTTPRFPARIVASGYRRAGAAPQRGGYWLPVTGVLDGSANQVYATINKVSTMWDNLRACSIQPLTIPTAPPKGTGIYRKEKP